MRSFIKSSGNYQKLSNYLITISLGTVFLLHLLTVIYTPYLNWDVAAYLTAGQMLIGGARPYAGIIDTNFPMIIYISAIPAAFSYLTQVPLAVAGIMFFFCIIILTMFLFGKILKLAFSELIHQQIYFIYIVWLYCSLWTYWNGNFGQREQLIFVFIAPFVILRHARHTKAEIPLWLSSIIAFMAFCGVAIKPFYIFPVLIIEAVQVCAHRRFIKSFIAIETFIVAFLIFLYVAHFYLFSGMSAFYDYWLGFMLRSNSVYGIGVIPVISELLNQPILYVYCMLAVFLCLLLLKNKNSLLLLSSCFGWFACCSLILYIFQARGWLYHLLPFYQSILLGMTLSFFAIQKIYSKKSVLFLPLLTVVLVVGLFFYYPGPFNLLNRMRDVPPFSFPRNKLVEMIESLTKPSDRVAFLSPSTGPGFPALTYTGRMLGVRFLTTFPIAWIFKHSSDYIPEKQWRDDEVIFYEMLETDVMELKPKLIFIATGDGLQGTASYFKITEYLRKKGFYKNISSLYNKIGDVKLHFGKAFEIWLLKEK